MVDLVTYLRTEWVSAALCTNQTPRAADVCLQLGTEDGRAVTFVPRTIREIITSSAESDGQLPIAARRQLKQQADRRQSGVQIKYLDQRCDNLDQTPDESVDVVLSLQAAHRMHKNGVDWKKSIREAARVLKHGGRLLFVEKTEIDGESYLEYVQNLYNLNGTVPDNLGDKENDPAASAPVPPIFEVGWDEVDLVLEPHVAGVAIKSELAGLTPQELARKKSKEEEDRLADLSIEAYERGRKKRKKKKNSSTTEETATTSAAAGKK
jgi:SAM-dependent methyltransferase